MSLLRTLYDNRLRGRAKAARFAADALEDEARRLREAAAAADSIAAEREFRDDMRTLWRRVEKDMLRGIDERDAVESALVVMVDEDDRPRARALLENQMRRSQTIARIRRNREIARLARTWTNAEIAKLYNISAASVTRALNQQLGQKAPRRRTPAKTLSPPASRGSLPPPPKAP